MTGGVTRTSLPCRSAVRVHVWWPSSLVAHGWHSPVDMAPGTAWRGSSCHDAGGIRSPEPPRRGGDLDTVGVSDPEPLLRYLCRFGAAVLDRVLVVEDVALHLEVRTIGHLHGPAVAQRRDQSLLDRGDPVPVPVFDLHRVADMEHVLLDLHQFRAMGVLEDQCLAQPQGFAVHLVDPLAPVVLDPVVIADRYQLLAHPVMICAATTAALQPPVSEHRPSSSSAGGAAG